jgi:hypothetical protein
LRRAGIHSYARRLLDPVPVSDPDRRQTMFLRADHGADQEHLGEPSLSRMNLLRFVEN